MEIAMIHGVRFSFKRLWPSATGSPGTTSERFFPDGEGGGSFWSLGASTMVIQPSLIMVNMMVEWWLMMMIHGESWYFLNYKSTRADD